MPNGNNYKTIICKINKLVLKNEKVLAKKLTISDNRYVSIEKIYTGAGFNAIYPILRCWKREKSFEENTQYMMFIAKRKEVLDRRSKSLANKVKILCKLDHLNVAKLLDCVPNMENPDHVILE